LTQMHLELKPELHLWSLGVEEQFYLTIPIVSLMTLMLRRNFLPVMVDSNPALLVLSPKQFRLVNI
jgi:peptidoglycan/LPS O-acetylase OafA/YrhL